MTYAEIQTSQDVLDIYEDKSGIGVFVRSINISPTSLQIVNAMNIWSQEQDECFLFCREPSWFPVPIKCGIMGSDELLGFYGTVIANDFDTAQIILNCPTIHRRILYVWDLEWMYTYKTFKEYSQIYGNPELELISRCDSHNRILTKVWKKPIANIEEFNYEELRQVVN